MPDDAPIPTLSSLRPKPRAAKASSRPKLEQPMFAFEAPPPVKKPYTPIVLAPPTPEPTLYTVRQLLNEIRQSVERTYATPVTVEGEISNCRPATSGHVYLTLKDGDAQLSVVMFRRQALLLGFKPRDGLQVEVRGRLSVYETRGQLQLVAETMRPRGEGALQLAFEQLKRRLAAEGLFHPDRKRPLPPFPHCIGIVTSPHGAALRDIIHIIRRRHARLNLLIYPATMQGPSCPASVAAGVRWFNAHPDRVDLILVTRGGGSFEDLAGFNDETLARTIAASQLPVVSAIGHEIDTTIADFVADLRAPTPSAAAELITAAQHRIEDRVLSLERRVHRAAQFHLMRARQRFSRLSADQVLRRTLDAVHRRQQKVDDLTYRLHTAQTRLFRTRQARLAALEARLRRQDPTVRLAHAQRRLALANDRIRQAATTLIARRRTRLDRAEARLHSLSPLAVLNRGYAIVYTQQGTILRSATEATPDQQIHARLAKGTLKAVVTSAEP